MKAPPSEDGLRRQDLARRGEQAAARFLEARGCAILARNVRYRHGELDIVARDGDTVVFVEVKTRTSTAFGLPQEAVGGRKQARLRALAAAWLHDRGLEECRCRFDVIAVQPTPAQDRARIEHIVSAF